MTVVLSDLSNELGIDKSNLRKYILALNIEFLRVRGSGNQLVLALTDEDAEFIRLKRREQGFQNKERIVDNGWGYFYIIQLVPDLDPSRVKLGYAGNVEARLATHKTSAPTALLINSWPCKRTWEIAALASVTRADCQLIASEVYSCGNIDNLVSRADQFFSLMPVQKEG